MPLRTLSREGQGAERAGEAGSPCSPGGTAGCGFSAAVLPSDITAIMSSLTLCGFMAEKVLENVCFLKCCKH